MQVGVGNLPVPMVDSAEQARALVAETTRYPPSTGIRGLSAARLVRFLRGTSPGYLQQANDEVCAWWETVRSCSLRCDGRRWPPAVGAIRPAGICRRPGAAQVTICGPSAMQRCGTR